MLYTLNPEAACPGVETSLDPTGYTHAAILTPGTTESPLNDACVAESTDASKPVLVRFWPADKLPGAFEDMEEAAETHTRHLKILEEQGLPSVAIETTPGMHQNKAGLFVVNRLVAVEAQTIRVNSKTAQTVIRAYSKYLGNVLPKLGKTEKSFLVDLNELQCCIDPETNTPTLLDTKPKYWAGDQPTTAYIVR